MYHDQYGQPKLKLVEVSDNFLVYQNSLNY